MFRTATALTFVLSLLPAQQRLLQPEDLAARATAAELLAAGLEQPTEAQKHTKQHPDTNSEQRLRHAVAKARLALPEGSAARSWADTLVQEDVALARLRQEAEALRADLTFRPKAEADLPDGITGFQALDELELRNYPKYRMVRTDGSRGSMGAFWPLFQHIQKKDIAMTTPVQVDYAKDGDGRRMATMAFLYGSPKLGETGVNGKVEVVDVAPMTVLTIGARGYDTKGRINDLRQRIDAWLKQNPKWQPVGEARTMIYNGPSTGAAQRYFEVQQPVKPRPKLRDSV
jgi:hypothetical protein